MKHILQLLLLTALFFLSAPTWAAVDYHLDLQLHPAQQQLEGTATISVRQFADRLLQLRLAPTAIVHQVRQGNRVIPYQFRGDRLSLQLFNDDPVTIDYSAIFNDPVATTPVHTEDPSFGISATISPVGTYLSAGTAWYPQISTADISYEIRIS